MRSRTIAWALTGDTRESTDEQGNKVTVPDIAKMVEAWTNPTMESYNRYGEVLSLDKRRFAFSTLVSCRHFYMVWLSYPWN